MRRIRKANIKFISLVPKGANKLEPVYKADGSFTLGCLTKASDTFDDKGELLCVVYAAEHRDSQGDIADREAIKEAAYGFIANGAGIDISHDGKALPKDRARVAENFLVQKTDPRFHGWKDADGKDVDLEGAWASVIKIDCPELRKKYRSGEWAGVSMGGTAIVEQEKADVDRLIEALTKAVNPPKPPKIEETEMDAKEMKELLTGFATEIVKALKPEAPKPPETPKVEPKKAPVFKGRLDNERDLQLHERAVALFALEQGTDFNDPASIRDYRESVKVLKADWAAEDEAAGVVTTKTGPLDRPAPTTPTLGLAGISKEDQAYLNLGKTIAEDRNKKLQGVK